MQSTKLSKEQKREQELLAAIEDPALFAHSILHQDLWSKQEEILRALESHRRVAVKACHSSGKTFLSAGAVLWWLARYKDAIVVTTAPSDTQVRTLLWGELHAAVAQSTIKFPQPHQTELRIGPKRYAIGFSARVDAQAEGVRFQGFHSGHILLILDEAPGVHPKIYEAIEGIRAGGDVRVLALGNPVIASGPFYDAFTEQRSGWKTITISAWDTPNFAGVTLERLLQMSPEELEDNERPYLITKSWVRERHDEWGPEHPLWESRVLGNFPHQSEDALIALTWLELAKVRASQAADEVQPVVAGIDVAGPGESETVLCVRQGGRIISIQAWAAADPRGELVAAIAPFTGRLAKINIDSAGIGYYLALHIAETFPEVEVVPVNVGEAPNDSERFFNLKAELYWGLRMRFQAGDISGMEDELTIAQLTGIRWKPNARGQTTIETKEDARKRGVKSPDRAEAVMLAFASIEPPEQETIIEYEPDYAISQY